LTLKPTAAARSSTTARSIATRTTQSPIRRPRALTSARGPRRFRTCWSSSRKSLSPDSRRVNWESSTRTQSKLDPHSIKGRDRQLGSDYAHVTIEWPPGFGLLTIDATPPRRIPGSDSVVGPSHSNERTTYSRRSRGSGSARILASASFGVVITMSDKRTACPGTSGSRFQGSAVAHPDGRDVIGHARTAECATTPAENEHSRSGSKVLILRNLANMGHKCRPADVLVG
jgi:hypothetical protein